MALTNAKKLQSHYNDILDGLSNIHCVIQLNSIFHISKYTNDNDDEDDNDSAAGASNTEI